MSRVIRIEEVIITELTSRGNGVTTPYRMITQVFTKDGKLIAEYDPLPEPKYEGRIDPKFDRGGIVGWCYDTKPNSKTDQESVDETVVTRNFKIAGDHDVTMRFVFADKVVAEPTYTRADLEELTDYFARNSFKFHENSDLVLRNWITEKAKHQPVKEKEEDEVKAAPFHSLDDYVNQHEFCHYEGTTYEWIFFTRASNGYTYKVWRGSQIEDKYISASEVGHIQDGSSKVFFARLKREYRR